LLALGIARRLVDDNDAASHHLSEALTLYQQIDDSMGQADAMTLR
jgi:tetratricopeptide (TPR) repeat protein